MSGMHDTEEAAIPLLSEVMVAGNPLRAHNVEEAKSATAAAVKAAVAEREGLFAHDADALVERLRGRCLTWLTGEGRAVIEARCSAAMQEHSTWLVGQVSREIGLALETELKVWVKAAVREELAARAGPTTAA
ncbi:DUF2486 family protein [Paraburkholderia unamae]|uniref:Uncharacterized protein DUF2486 n=1 Tax=Paraburkholderia unamae TaxID=219649 RepID=A0ABX5KN30_9BURK|nr:DUF2486 family protein [Paraburkholderia unamae]PVX82359.1 uncharacterized protein DUF2486 [Paraburkholderia unamae]RAR60683.1 uncharacterized protein DUF2486 [Paraburkholderia unamae]CAG9255802.1 conserved hypothetical protein [Paraburkholderia unamae]